MIATVEPIVSSNAFDLLTMFLVIGLFGFVAIFTVVILVENHRNKKNPFYQKDVK